MRKAYPSDLTDEQWALLEPLVPPAKSGGAPRTVNMREVLNTLFYQNRSGCQWDMLPHDLLPKSTVFDYFTRWRDDGTWQKLVDALRARVRTAARREPTPSAGAIDSPRLLMFSGIGGAKFSKNFSRRDLMNSTLVCANEPFVRELPGGSRG